MTKWALAVCLMILLAAVAIVEAKSYSADRFDTRIDVLHGGSIRVVETVVLRFDSGTFTQFYRLIPTRHTDGIEIESAAMDGRVLPAGTKTGQVEISGGDRVQVTWRFPAVSDGTHRFDLTYTARGAVRQEEDSDLLMWRALPTEHRYTIRAATVDVFLPVAPVDTPSAVLHQTADSAFALDGTHARISVADIRNNGWIEARVRLPRGAVLDAAPAWQQRDIAADALARYWVVAAALVALFGFVVLLTTRQGYAAPSGSFAAMTGGSTRPDALPAPLAGALVTNGMARLEHAMATLFAMADRGELAIEERPRSLGHRNFSLTQTSASRSREPYEEAALAIAFGGRRTIESSVTLSAARARLARRFRKFSVPLASALQSAGLLDEGRRAVRRRYRTIAATTLAFAGAAAIAAASSVVRFGVWPFLISAALAIVGIAALGFYAAHTPLSDQGLRRAQEWRAFRQYLRDVARDREPLPADSDPRRLLPFAVALGVAPAWSAYVKRHRAAAPPWFRAIAESSNDAAAFATLIATGGAGTGAGGAGAGGAGGGGASGAS